MISHGILPILLPNCTKFVLSLVATKKLSSDLESQHFQTFSAKRHKLKIGQRDGHGKSRNGHGKVMEKIFCQVCGNPAGVLSQYYNIPSPFISKSLIGDHAVH